MDMMNNIVNNGTNYEKLFFISLCYSRYLRLLKTDSWQVIIMISDFEKLKWDENC
jgi:hypothetical protein